MSRCEKHGQWALWVDYLDLCDFWDWTAKKWDGQTLVTCSDNGHWPTEAEALLAGRETCAANLKGWE